MTLTNRDPAPVWQLIKRDFNASSPTYGKDLMTLDILGPGSGAQGVSMAQTFSGFYHAPRTSVRQSWAYQEGSTPSEFPRVEERLLDFRLVTRGLNPGEWERIDALLWQILTFSDDAVLRVSSATSAPREIKIRLDRKPKDSWTIDPRVACYQVWDITAVAVDPYWYSTELKSSWTNNMGTGSGTLTFQNPSDVECWVQFASNTIVSPQTWTLPDGISGSSLTLPQIGVGQEFYVDTYPLSETLMVMDESQAWAKMNSKAFLYSIPPQTPPTTVPISVSGGGTSAMVTAYMMQRWDRPFSVDAPWQNNVQGVGFGGFTS